LWPGPVIGTPQGLAIYQNGVRINEVFGDIVNWDLIPEKAINGMTLVPSNPVSPVITKAPSSVLPPSVVHWTGIYLGVNAGCGFGASAWKDSVTVGSTGNFGVSGFLAGGTLGANYQVGSVVFGVEGDGALD
jgi:hypothetical protein